MGALMSLSRTATSFWLGFSEWALLAAGILLVIGLVGEHKLPDFHALYKRFEFLVVIGCAGELFADGGIFFFSRRLETLSNMEIAELQKAAAPRELTSQQQTKIGAALSKYSGRAIWIRSYRGDPEAKRLGREIISALHLAHIEPEDRLEGLDGNGSMLFGIEVQCAETGLHSQRDFARALIDALSSKGAGNLAVAPLSEFGCPSEEITEIDVGIKPPTVLDDRNSPAANVAGAERNASSRHLTPEAIGRIRLALQVSPAQQIGASWNVRDTEINAFAMDFSKACCTLGTAEWQMGVSIRGAKAGLVGILVLVRPDADTKSREAAGALATALRAEHLTVDGPREAGSLEPFLAPARPQDSSIPVAPIMMVIAKTP